MLCTTGTGCLPCSLLNCGVPHDKHVIHGHSRNARACNGCLHSVLAHSVCSGLKCCMPAALLPQAVCEPGMPCPAQQPGRGAVSYAQESGNCCKQASSTDALKCTGTPPSGTRMASLCRYWWYQATEHLAVLQVQIQSRICDVAPHKPLVCLLPSRHLSSSV